MQESHFWVFCLETLAEELEKIKNVKTKEWAKQLKVYLVTGYTRVRLAHSLNERHAITNYV